MESIKITIRECSESDKANMQAVSGAVVGKYKADVEYGGAMLRLFCREDHGATKEDKDGVIYSQTQMLQIHDKIKFGILAISDGRIEYWPTIEKEVNAQ